VTRQLSVASASLLRALAYYGSPAALAADTGAAARLERWGRQRLSADTVAQVVASARTTLGVDGRKRGQALFLTLFINKGAYPLS
jgi:hypothetical protein